MTTRKKRKKKTFNNKKVLIGLLSVLAILVILCLVNNFRIVWNISDKESIHWEYASDKPDTDVSAVFKGNIFCRKGNDLVLTSSGSVDSKTLGTQEVTFTAKNFIFKSTRTVVFEISDKHGPEITLVTDPDHVTYENCPYVEEGFQAIDSIDGDVTDKVVREEKEGKVYYTVSDSSGNTTTVVRDIIYTKMPENDGHKLVYLTFDDGPDKYTPQLLDILDKYNIKVTFFVTNQSPPNVHLIEDEFKRGHTVAVHSYSHDYKKIYANKDAFMEDFHEMDELVKQYTGTNVWLMRFPGGTSTTYIKQLEPFTNELDALGVQYCDWNVSSEDAVGDPTTESIKNNVINGIQNHDVSIVLQHDIKEESVNAVEDIIKWGLENGYTFLPMTPNMEMIHHGR